MDRYRYSRLTSSSSPSSPGWEPFVLYDNVIYPLCVRVCVFSMASWAKGGAPDPGVRDYSNTYYNRLGPSTEHTNCRSARVNLYPFILIFPHVIFVSTWMSPFSISYIFLTRPVNLYTAPIHRI